MGHGAVSKALADYILDSVTMRNTISVAIYEAGILRRRSGFAHTHFRAVRE